MKRIAFIALLMLAGECGAQIQFPYILNPLTVAPSGSCAGPQIQVLGSNGHVWTCDNGTWADATASGSGTVTSVTFTGDGTVLSSTPSSAVTTSGTVTATLANTPTGTGGVVLANTPTLVTPVLGVATATTVNKVTLTAPATGSTLTIANGKTLTASNSLTLGGTDSTTMTFPPVSATVDGIVAVIDTTGLVANVSTATLYAIPAGAGGLYRVSCYEIETIAATVSSTLPACFLAWTDVDTGAGAKTSSAGSTFSFTPTSASNAVGVTNVTGVSGTSNNSIIAHAAQSTNISYGTTGYATSGAQALTYALHIKVEYLGP
jgi:hypothetical protein